MPSYTFVSDAAVMVSGFGVIVSVPFAVISILVKYSVTSLPPASKMWKEVTSFTAFSPAPGVTFVTVPSAVAVQVRPSGTPVTVKSSCAVFVSGVPSYTLVPSAGITLIRVSLDVTVSVPL